MLYASAKERLFTQHLSISEIIKTIPEEKLYLHPIAGKWSIHDNIAHLARYQLVFRERLDRILKTPEHYIERYIAENDPGFTEWQQKKTPEVMGQLQSERNLLIQFLVALNNSDLDKSGQHEKFGILKIPEWTEFFLLHEAHHIYTIFQLAHDRSR